MNQIWSKTIGLLKESPLIQLVGINVAHFYRLNLLYFFREESFININHGRTMVEHRTQVEPS